MMRFKDYPIKITTPENSIFVAKSEDVDETLIRINGWVESNEHIVLNIETLFFPGLNNASQGTGTAYFKTGEVGGSATFFQVFRVWYKEINKQNPPEYDKLV